MESLAFEDRRGNTHYPKLDSIVKSREGSFSCCIYKGKILLIWPDYAPDVPELAGGGIDLGEDVFEANQREFIEETGFVFPFLMKDIKDTHQQIVHFYAEDVDEYWTYHQTFFLFDGECEAFYFQGERPTPENGVMRWVSLDEVVRLPVQYMHRKALKKFGIIKDDS